MVRFFEPPTVQDANQGDVLFSRFASPQGQTVFVTGSTVTVSPVPWMGDLVGLTEGVDYFLGGRVYLVSEAQALVLTNAGYTVDDSGFGVGGFGEGGFGR